ncbi:MAG: flagellar protein FlaG [Clostridia bacterium]|nr:flagellar protein FlaG [Clostridia bacterium]
MRIDGMDAPNVVVNTQQNSQNDIKVNQAGSKHVTANIDNKNISNLTDYEKSELPISDKVVINAIEKANKAISGANRKFEFSIHEKTKEIMVKVINAETNEVIREIPHEKILDMVAKMWEMAGIIVDERR